MPPSIQVSSWEKDPNLRQLSHRLTDPFRSSTGNSGGPLLDSNGKLIGMNTAIYSPSGASSGIGFAIPIDTVKFIVETLIREGEGQLLSKVCVPFVTSSTVSAKQFSLSLVDLSIVVRPVLGISYLESKQARALGIQNGVLVLDVPEGSPAYQAGLRGTRRTEAGLIELGDIISKVGDTVINTEADLFKALENLKPGDIVKVTISRVAVVPEGGVSLETLELAIPLQSSAIFERKLEFPSQRIPSPIPQ